MSSPISTEQRNGFAMVAGGSTAFFVAVIFAVYRFRPTVGALFLILGWIALLGAAYFLVAAVLAFDLTPGEESLAVAVGRRTELEREKKLLLKAIKEVEFDRDLGKVDAAEAAVVVGRYRTRALEVMRLIDTDALKPYEAKVEAELERRLAAGGTASPPAAPAPAAAAPVAAAPPEPAAAADERPVCGQCGLTNDPDASFCKKCGSKVGAA